MSVSQNLDRITFNHKEAWHPGKAGWALDKYLPTIDNADIVSTASIISGSDMP